MNKENYMDLALKLDSSTIVSFNEKTSDAFIYLFFKMIYCVVIVLFILIVATFGLFFANSELLKIVTKISGYMANSVLPFSFAITTISLMHKRGKQVKLHKWIYKIYMRNLIKMQFKSGYYNKDEYEKLITYINKYDFKVETNKISFNEVLVSNVLEEMKSNGFFNVKKLGSYKPKSADEDVVSGKWINQAWNRKKLLTYWKRAIDKNVEYSKYKAFLFNVGDDSYFVYENNEINEVIEKIKSIIHSVEMGDYVNEIGLLIRQMNLASTLSVKDDEQIKVRKKV